MWGQAFWLRSVGMDKALFKDVMRTHGIPVVESIVAARIRP